MSKLLETTWVTKNYKDFNVCWTILEVASSFPFCNWKGMETERKKMSFDKPLQKKKTAEFTEFSSMHTAMAFVFRSARSEPEFLVTWSKFYLKSRNLFSLDMDIFLKYAWECQEGLLGIGLVVPYKAWTSYYKTQLFDRFQSSLS